MTRRQRVLSAQSAGVVGRNVYDVQRLKRESKHE